MAYSVEIIPRAERDLDNVLAWAAHEAPLRGPLWFGKLQGAIQSRSESPERCTIVPSLSTPRRMVRQLLYGRKRHVYRIYFTVVTVKILHIRHGARRDPKRL